MATDESIVNEVVGKLEDYENSMSTLLDETNEIADKFRMIPGSSKKGLKGLSNTVTSEMASHTETLATFWWKQMWAEAPNFALFPTQMGVFTQDIRQHTALLEEQNTYKRHKAKSLESLRSLALFGSVFVDEPYVLSEDGMMEYTALNPKGLLECAWDRTVQDINQANWVMPLYFVSAASLLRMSREDKSGKVWRQAAVEQAIHASGQTDGITQRVRTRLQSAGYIGGAQQTVMELALYQGVLDENNDYKDMVVGVVNRKHLVRIHENVLPHRRKMTRYLGFKKFELEPLAYGVGREGLRIQKDMDANRNRIQDIITFALLGIWKVARRANLDYSQMQIKPWNIVELDDPESLQPVRPDVDVVNYGISLERMMKEDFQRLTGATDNLQAVVTDVTAREAILAMNNAVRKVASYGEIIAEDLLEEHYGRAIANNQKFFDRAMWLSWTGSDTPVEVLPNSIQKPMRAKKRIITDKDFTPARVTRLLTFLGHLVSIRSNLPQEFNPMPIIEALGLALDVDVAQLRTPPQRGPIAPERMKSLQAALAQAQGEQAGAGGAGGFHSSPTAELPASVPLGEL